MNFLFRQAEIYKHGRDTELSRRCMKGSNSFDIGRIVISVGPNFWRLGNFGTFIVMTTLKASNSPFGVLIFSKV